ncbi:MAG: hypothetical protein NTAFB01_07960 [Nitrospira sp.]
MFTSPNTTTHRLMIFLVALSGLGALVASQQYFILQSEEEMVLARQTLEESFLSTIRQAAGESNPEIAQRLAQRKTSIEGIYSSATAMIRHLEVRAMADFIGWCVVLGISGWTLTITALKKPKPDDPSTVSSASDE